MQKATLSEHMPRVARVYAMGVPQSDAGSRNSMATFARQKKHKT